MKKNLFLLFQFFPLTIFMMVARIHGFNGEAWPPAFKWGALAAVIGLFAGFTLIGAKPSRLLLGANFFLIFGGVAFFFEITPALRLLGYFETAGPIFFVGIVCILSVLTTATGIFEKKVSNQGLELKYSIYFLLALAAALVWALAHRHDATLGGAAPFVFLIILKNVFQKKMQLAR